MSTLYAAILFSGIIAICFPIGGALSLKLNIGHKVISAVMSLGAGLLIGAATIDLIPTAGAHLSPISLLTTIVAAAAIFSASNWGLSRLGAKHRQRCSDCRENIEEASEKGSDNGAAIALGTVMDALPEALVLGVSLASGANPIPLVIAIGLGNIAQSLSSTSGLKASGKSGTHIFLGWLTLGVVVMAVTIFSAVAIGEAGDHVAPWVEAFAAGVLLAMVCEAMLPEASENSPAFSGVTGVLGVVFFVALHSSG